MVDAYADAMIAEDEAFADDHSRLAEEELAAAKQENEPARFRQRRTLARLHRTAAIAISSATDPSSTLPRELTIKAD